MCQCDKEGQDDLTGDTEGNAASGDESDEDEQKGFVVASSLDTTKISKVVSLSKS